ncbi:glycosyltransferase family 4 protein [Pseudoflavitalea sp. G-6-1-2]|uniref:glycosyltransferase family 4 protein n=1 Tax=Pseudoflavitalea sp. G-6-1-2 TaxID=2728841 RepID=UPI00146E18C3|nr:glycosyltransferase family 4 protein [Pseudoflavitalea sp. G-6-1-2]NML23015.1 glycosyltransferase family 4 protein [Pseudoflavitalea sp. G-6-1-2]
MTRHPAKNKLIAFVSNSAWSVYNFRMDVISNLLGQGYNVLIIAPDDAHSIYLKEAGCHFLPIDFNNKTANPISDWLFYRQLKKLYRQYRPDFIFHYVAKPNIYGSLAANAVKIPSVAVITGLGYPFAKRNWLYYTLRFLYTKALRHTNEVWFLNNEDAKVFITENIVNIEKAKVLPGEGVNTDYFSPSFERIRKKDDVFTFTLCTRLLRSKGIGIYADAARILKKKNYIVRFELVGFFESHHPDSITQEDLKRWEQEGLIHYCGFAEDVRPYLERADCFVFPSFYNEGVPRCLMEAASMELPIITAFNRGCKEVVLNNSTGYICKGQDPFDLADKMEKMINLPAEDRARMGKNGRSLVVKKFGVERVIEEYISTLNQDMPD